MGLCLSVLLWFSFSWNVLEVENPCHPVGCLDLFDSDWFSKCESREKLVGAKRRRSQDDWWFSKCESNRKVLGVKRSWSQDASRSINFPKHSHNHHLEIYIKELRLVLLNIFVLRRLTITCFLFSWMVLMSMTMTKIRHWTADSWDDDFEANVSP